MSGYGQFAEHYLAAGWSPLPLPDGKKTPPPSGWTGVDAPMVSFADMADWCTSGIPAKGKRPAVSPAEIRAGNIALRMPVDVVGIDVDAYKPETDAVMLELSTRLGALPPTWRSSSRTDGRSGIYLYRLPRAVTKIGDVAKGAVETIHHGWRYAVVGPSTHPGDDRTAPGAIYRWFAPDGGSKAPKVDALPFLPEPWVAFLEERGADTKLRETSTEPTVARDDLDPAERVRLDSYLVTAVNGILGDLRESASWPVGYTDGRKRGWEKLQADKAIRLAGLALADWNTLTMAEAERIFVEAAPTGGQWTKHDVVAKFHSQVSRATPTPPPAPSKFDIFANAMMSPAPDSGGGADATGTAAVKRPFDDRGLAERVYEQQHGRLLYLRDTGTWARWHAERWEIDVEAGQRAVQRVVELAPAAERHLYADMSLSDYGKLTAHCRVDRTTSTATSYLRKTGAMDARLTDFDQHPDLLLVGNGVVNLRTGDLLANAPEMLLMKGTDVALDTVTPPAEFLAWLAWAQPDPAMREYLQLIIGASLTGEPIKRYWVHEGKADAGKSMLLNLVMRAIGDLGTSISDNLITGRDGVASDDYARARLFGARTAVLDEVKLGGHTLDVSIKRLVGGAALVGRNPTERPFTFRPYFKLHIAANTAPTNSPEQAIASRLEVVRWENGSTPEMRRMATERLGMPLNVHLERFELGGILAWAVQGAVRFYAGGEQLHPPYSIQAATDEHLADSDLVAQWLAERTVENFAAAFTAAQGWADFKMWQESRGERVYSTQRMWGLRMSDVVGMDPMMSKVKSHGVSTYRGRGLRTHIGLTQQ